MITVLTADAMRQCDRYTIEELGVPSCVLMERAAYEVAREVLRLLPSDRAHASVLVLAGSGNNGGDGYACARILHLRGVSVAVMHLGNPDHMTDETRRQSEIAARLGIAVLREADYGCYDLIVDAVLGIGLTREVKEDLAAVFEEVERSGVPVVAVDIPSGIAADTGAVCGRAVRAVSTVTMQAGKPGLYLYPGAEYAGKVTEAEIGVVVGERVSGSAAYTPSDLPSLLPVRSPAGHKGSFGKILIIAGSENMAGASYLASSASYAAGSGMVRILTTSANREILQKSLPEAMLAVWEDPGEIPGLIAQYLPWADAIACGPGLGTGMAGETAVKSVLEQCAKPLVLDADALNIVSRRPEMLKEHEGEIYITPHVVEFSRLSGHSVSSIRSNLACEAAEFAKEYGVVCVLKDARSVTASPDGSMRIALAGNNGMATAGSGDVLTGILVSFIGQGVRGADAGGLACLVHGMAGDAAARLHGPRSMKAGDILAGIEEVLKSVDPLRV